MDSKNQDKISLMETLKKPYIKYSITISVAIIIFMVLTQSYWMNFGITSIYKEYQASEVLPNNTVPNGVFILSGNYSYISYWINTTKVSCDKDKDIKLLVISVKTLEGSSFRNVVILDAIDGCNKIK